ncbi:MAG: formimidoylglutamase [Flavobacteriaceae bacterium]|nr:MAG: formimidoylglutamase [Flavobacteriaceae bacterium]
MFKRELNVDYKPGQRKYWTGRKSNPDIGKQYWYQEIEIINIEHLQNQGKVDIALLGYVCDEGVRRNLGRVGAQKGPRVLREQLAKLPIHFDRIRVADIGDIICLEDSMEDCQDAFAELIRHLITENIFPIAIGGGHDMAYGHFMGIHNAIKNTPKNRVGIINFDAHFDLRPVETKPNSGTPFNQIIAALKETKNTIDYFAIGIQRQSNIKQLFDIAKQEHIEYALNYDCESSHAELQALKDKLQPFIDRNDYLYITIDMDGFSSAFAPGVSAPSPLGFTPRFVFKMLKFLFETNKVISCDIAELNPTLDRDNLTVNLAAKLVDFIVSITNDSR